MPTPTQKQLLTGWQFYDGAKDTWLDAQVPGHVHGDLLRHGLIEDPFVRRNEKLCEWVDERDWSYRCQFDWQPKDRLEHRVLRFDGLDTVCSIFLNGDKVADHDNMFVPLEVEVSDRLQAGSNEIRVDFQSAARVGRERKVAYFAEQGLAEDTPNFDERAFVRKAQYMFGWDWGPRLVSCGVWKLVWLIEFDERVDPVSPRAKLLEDGRGRVEIDSYPPAVGKPVRHVIMRPDDSEENEFLDDAGFFVKSPDIWSLDAPIFYRVYTSRFADYSEQELLDQSCVRFAIRSLKLVQTPDQFGTSFEFELNGRRLYAFGANWIPDHSFPSQVTPDRLRQRLQQAKDMGMNMLRLWGGGIYESDEFYDICDELGILIWQDFMFACSYYPDTPEWQEAVRKEAECQVLRLRHHPCIALWCGNNECHQVWQDGWGGKDKQPPRFHGEVLYHEVLADVVKRLDPERAYVPGSPSGGEYCNQGGIGDQHFWDVWHGRGDWMFYSDSTARFCSEFGFMSSPSKATWARAGVETTVAVEDPDARWHNKTGKPFEIIKGLVELHYPEATNLDEWIYYTQLNQRDAMRAALEHFRFSEFCRGALIWQLNDCWPVESWSLLEFDGRKKAAAYECSRLFAPLLLRLDVEGSGANLRACLHNSEGGVEGEAKLEAFSLKTGQSLCSENIQLELKPEETKTVLSASVVSEDSVVWVGSLGDNRAFRTLAKSTGIDEKPLIRSTAVGKTVELTADQVAIDIFIEDVDNPQNTFEPNFFCLLAGGSIAIRASAPAGRLRIRCLKFD